MIARLRRFASPAQLWDALRHAADVTTPEGRSRERFRRVALAASASILAKAITILTGIVSVPLTLHYLGPERYGIWMVISSFTVMLSFADMGLGNGILNAIAREHGRDDRAAIRTIVSSGYAMLAVVGAAIALGFAISYPFVDWFRIFNVRSALARAEAGPALAAFIACFALTIPLGLVQKVQTGLQQGFVSSLWQCLGSVMGLIAVLIAIALHAGLPWLVAALVGLPLTSLALNTLMFFRAGNADIAPRLGAFSRSVALASLRTGLMFFLLQLVVSVAYGADSIIVAQNLGADAVAQYAVPERMFSMITMLLMMVLSPLWPAYGEAIERGDHRWVKQALKRAILTAAATSALLSGALVLVGPWLIDLWVGPQIRPTLLLLVGLAIWKITEATASALSIYMNGANLLRTQIILSIISGAAMVALKLVLINRIGVAGIPLAAAATFIPLVGIPMAVITYRRLNPRQSAPEGGPL